MMSAYAFVVASLVLFSNRVQVFGDLAIRDERYTVDIVAIGMLGAAMLITPRASEDDAAAFRRPLPRALTSTRVLAGISAAVLISLVVGNVQVVSRVGVSAGRAWLSHLTAEIDRRAPVNLYDTQAPQKVFPPIAREGSLSRMLAPLGDKVTFDRDDAPLLVVDGNGRLKPARIENDSHADPGPAPGCGYALQPGQSQSLRMSSQLFDFQWGLQVTAFAGVGGVLRVVIDGRETQLRIDKGFARHQVVFQGPVHQVRLDLLVGSQPICVTELYIGLVKPGAVNRALRPSPGLPGHGCPWTLRPASGVLPGQCRVPDRVSVSVRHMRPRLDRVALAALVVAVVWPLSACGGTSTTRFITSRSSPLPAPLGGQCWPLPRAARFHFPYQVTGQYLSEDRTRWVIVLQWDRLSTDEVADELGASLERGGFAATGTTDGWHLYYRAKRFGDVAYSVEPLRGGTKDLLVRGDIRLDLPIRAAAGRAGHACTPIPFVSPTPGPDVTWKKPVG